ncbi:MAG TPA: acyltransferase [Ktedonobacterales bacterium]|jgi:peptidoglycan/LPS O-acetylase OafA/YrhL|nr:acyltransferase [Ktedonobacterales bacterium]
MTQGARIAPTVEPTENPSQRGVWRHPRAWVRWLRPLGSGPQEIAALDGLRALAALSVLVYHAMSIAGARTIIAGHDLTWTYFYTESGVDLFFTLSGFLLFLPYARAILDGRKAPVAREFYRRRALRILPAYYVCLAVVTLSQLNVYGTLTGAQNVLAHLVLLHDISPAFNRTISGPFWTLAVEWQFYLVLPLIAWALGRIGEGSPRRLIAGVLGVIALALALREVDALLATHRGAFAGPAAPWIDFAQRVVIGSQGKYLEVFGAGMLCSVVYTWLKLRPGALTSRRAQLAGVALLASSLLIYLSFAPLVYERRNAILAAFYLALRPTDVAMIAGPLVLGVGYSALTLGALLAPPLLRAPFEWAPLRFIGLISYSLYLWHETIINLVFPLISVPSGVARGIWALTIGFCIAIPFAYVSYQLVERPFLRWRRSSGAARTTAPAVPQVNLRLASQAAERR